ncbi:hypothetical protein LPBF_04390 [Flavobacterium crassostreae]|uniref:Uncharacterized protein n=1 Tax=Flavobacterium crassostreae TaxID=1763534 RepID=A0A1B9E5N4_9FLAO|nr:hypothetical protein [Flavobacterium crassostreae]OCB77245.1 hypothetical protein LPBF_04390 [Flavobacterium crassostreae]
MSGFFFALNPTQLLPSWRSKTQNSRYPSNTRHHPRPKSVAVTLPIAAPENNKNQLPWMEHSPNNHPKNKQPKKKLLQIKIRIFNTPKKVFSYHGVISKIGS